MRQNGGEVGEGGQHDEGPDEGVECSLTSNVDATEEGRYDCTQDDRVEWILVLLVYRCEKATKWGGIVASESPEYATGGQVAPKDCDGGRYECDDEETQGAPCGAGGLAINFGEGKEVRGVEDGFEIVNAVEDSNEVEKSREESNNELC